MMDVVDNSEQGSTDDDQVHRTKVGRLIDEYGLSGLGEELERRWLADDSSRLSLRELATHFNQRILATAIEEAGGQTVEGEVENIYKLLNSDDLSERSRAEVQTKLSRIGVDEETLLDAFVSHQAIHSYLTTIRGANLDSKSASASDTLDNRKGSIQKLRNRIIAVAEWNIQNLNKTNRLSIGTFDVTATVTVHCRDCGKSFDVTELFDIGSCDC